MTIDNCKIAFKYKINVIILSIKMIGHVQKFYQFQQDTTLYQEGQKLIISDNFRPCQSAKAPPESP